MNMKKTMAAVAASALAISAIAVPASAEVADAAVLGTKFTYSLVKTYDVVVDGSTQIQSQTEVAVPSDGFLVSLESIDKTKEITVSIVPVTAGTAPWTATFILTGDNQTFLPAGISYTADGVVDSITGDDGDTTDDFLIVTSTIAGSSIVTVKATAVIKPVTEGNLYNAVNGGYGNQGVVTQSFQTKKTLNLYDDSTANGGASIVVGTATGLGDLAVKGVQTGKMVTGLVKPAIKTASRPYKSSLNGKSAGAQDIIGWLTNTGGAADVAADIAAIAGKPNDGTPFLNGSNKPTNNYANVQAVLNDCITSYDNVTFTFNTAKEKVLKDKVGADAADFTGFYNSIRGWGGDDTYMKAFGQSLYNLYGDDASNYQPFDPNIYFNPGIGVAYNLFSGALIINDQFTMQLADTNVFSYNGTSLTFDWASLKDNVYTTTNTYLDLIWTMKLATSLDWYWDSLDVAFAVDSGDTGESEAPVTEDDELIDDEPADVPVDEPADILPEEPVAPAANPGTGNAPVALAVIPVALAAAAIIAKKRK
jgi:hypothetical protein